MNVLAHCRVYPLSTFYDPTAISIDWLYKDLFGKTVFDFDEDDSTSNLESSKRKLGPIAFLHLIEHTFKVSTFKLNLLKKLVQSSPSQSFVLIIDVMSCWHELIPSLSVEDRSAVYMNSSSLLHFDALVNFLSQLNENPPEALSRCQSPVNMQHQLAGIVIDNISYYTHDSASYDLLFKLLRMLRKKYGCYTVTVGYGLEFYNGVEQQQPLAPSQGYDIPTRLPMSYVKNMDCVVLRETDELARTVYLRNS
ncbi:LADA_0E11716g1_1 [Lachancea dasiensis]|uniref:LADA_0E11716g1_1 n=1 Tax=Lachancea dasiensis TaxID=1072105 RepID=A0A1G4JER0_9SACH|nr:LADA_0E11716g1_1 [Lachancea dasiensis]